MPISINNIHNSDNHNHNNHDNNRGFDDDTDNELIMKRRFSEPIAHNINIISNNKSEIIMNIYELQINLQMDINWIYLMCRFRNGTYIGLQFFKHTYYFYYIIIIITYLVAYTLPIPPTVA